MNTADETRNAATAVKAKLRRTWPIFFARHGNLTPIQVAAIPPILDGHNTLIVSATASGKTEAAIVPLLERHIFRTHTDHGPKSLALLFICPTRALTRDLYERLTLPLEQLHVSMTMKTGDTSGFSFQAPPAFLITTPESTDSLLTRAPRIFTQLRAIVLDEIHLFDNGPRGDHLLCLLRRIEHIRAYHQEKADIKRVPLQRIALSATVPDPEGLAERYLTASEWFAPDGASDSGASHPRAAGDRPIPYEVVFASGQRDLDAVIERLADLSDLAWQMNQRAREPIGARKSLVFCNSRKEVEEVAAFLNQRLDYAATVFVHYSNLDAVVRQEVETDFAAAAVAVCVCTSTLELGIDIGSIDDIVLIGAPPTLSSFLQRIGRGGRRTSVTRVLCLARTGLEEVRFRALIALTHENRLALTLPSYHFRPSVLVQQIFSILKQSPTGAIRLADLRRVVPVPFSDQELQEIFRNLVRLGYLKVGRIGEWRPAAELDELLDAHEIYSNIGSDPLAYQIVDTFTGRTIAQTDRLRMEGDLLAMGGRLLEVVWRDRSRIGVRRHEGAFLPTEMRFASAPYALSLEVSQGIARYLGLQPGQLVLLRDENGARLFHFWGAVYGELLTVVLRAQLYPEINLPPLSTYDEDEDNDENEVLSVLWPTVSGELAIRLPEPLLQLPPLDSRTAFRQLRLLAPRVEPFLSLGRFHSLLPPGLAHDTVLAICDFPNFEELYQSATIIAAWPELREQLMRIG